MTKKIEIDARDILKVFTDQVGWKSGGGRKDLAQSGGKNISVEEYQKGFDAIEKYLRGINDICN